MERITEGTKARSSGEAAHARPSSKDLISALKLNTPSAITEPRAHIDRDIPRRALYARMWEEVKAS